MAAALWSSDAVASRHLLNIVKIEEFENPKRLQKFIASFRVPTLCRQMHQTSPVFVQPNMVKYALQSAQSVHGSSTVRELLSEPSISKEGCLEKAVELTISKTPVDLSTTWAELATSCSNKAPLTRAWQRIIADNPKFQPKFIQEICKSPTIHTIWFLIDCDECVRACCVRINCDIENLLSLGKKDSTKWKRRQLNRVSTKMWLRAWGRFSRNTNLW